MKVYEPELGQAVFGQPAQALECPEYVQDALEAIRWTLVTLLYDIYNDPFDNTGAGKFECDVFKVHAYSWGEEPQEFNFAWREVRMSWYKYLGRGMSINRVVTRAEVRQMLIECLEALLSGQSTVVS